MSSDINIASRRSGTARLSISFRSGHNRHWSVNRPDIPHYPSTKGRGLRGISPRPPDPVDASFQLRHELPLSYPPYLVSSSLQPLCARPVALPRQSRHDIASTAREGPSPPSDIMPLTDSRTHGKALGPPSSRRDRSSAHPKRLIMGRIATLQLGAGNQGSTARGP